jgi:hypothetical protein
MMGQKSTKAIPAPTTTAPEGHSAPWDYQEEPDVVPAENPTEAIPSPAPTLPKGHSAPRHDHGESEGHPTPWDYQEEPDVECGAL